MKSEFDLYRERTKEAEVKFGNSFCLSKWYHSNIYFQTGETHSCYHPAPHKIERSLLNSNPSALHNTPEKMDERQQMVNGQRPKGCQYCWNIEDLNSELISDRQIRTGSLYNEQRMQEIDLDNLGTEITPDYIEISFSNLCNFKCGYCHPKASSRYLQEIKQFGPYDMVKNHRCDIDWFKIYDEEDNPYLDAWWNWWPALSRKLTILRLTGGEPLIQKSTTRLFELMRRFPNPKLEFNVNSNMGAKTEIISKFCSDVNELLDSQSIRRFKLYTSVDTWGSQAEYVRTGLDLNLFEKNIKTYLENTTAALNFMITFNLFSVPNFSELLKKILEWRSQYQSLNNDFESMHRIRFDISYLKEPLHFDINLLPKEEFMPLMEQHLEFFRAHVDDTRKDRFSFMEYQRFLRIYEYMKSTIYPEEELKDGRREFALYFAEYDRRRNTNLLGTFPELSSFLKMCGSEK